MNIAGYTRFLSGLVVAAVFAAAAGPLLANDNEYTDPKNFAQWTVMGPDGGDARTVVIDPRDKDRLYISTLDGQIHTSADGGKTWRLLVNLEQPQLVIDDLMVDRRDSSVLYAAGHRHKGAGGFFKSTDGGKTWMSSAELAREPIHAMAQSEADPDQLFVGTTGGVWRSLDSGDTWSRISSESMPINVNSLAVDPKNPTTIYAGTWWRPYKSTDDGKSWRLIKDGMIDDSDVFAITINDRNHDHIVASACSGIYQSFNGGEKWTKVQGIPSTSRRTRDILQHPTKPGTLYAATTAGFWMSTNGGRSWTMTTDKNLEINAVAVHPDAPDRVFIATNNHGVMVSEDAGRNFAPTNGNFSSRFVYKVRPDIAIEGRLYAATHNTASSGGYFFISKDGGKSWTPARGLDPNSIAPFALLQDRDEPNRMLLGTNHGIYRSLDRGESWILLKPPPAPRTAAQRRAAAAEAKKRAEAGLPEPIPALAQTVRYLAFTEDGLGGIYAGTDNGLYRTYDINNGWEKLPFGEGINENVFAVHSTPNVPGTIWVGTATSGVIVSTDEGKTWKKIGEAGGPPQNIPVVAITTDPTRPNLLYAGTTQSLYLSRDGGRTWMRRGGNLPLGKYTSILIDPEDPDKIFVSSSLETSGGVFYSKDAGLNWERVDSKDMMVPSRRVWAMAFDPSNSGRIFAASHSSGVYRIDRIAEMAERKEEAEAKAAEPVAARALGN